MSALAHTGRLMLWKAPPPYLARALPPPILAPWAHAVGASSVTRSVAPAPPPAEGAVTLRQHMAWRLLHGFSRWVCSGWGL